MSTGRLVLLVLWTGIHGQWRVYGEKGKQGKPLTLTATKAETIHFAREMALVRAEAGEPTEVVIHLKNGDIEDRRTYPRSSDPRRSKG